MEIMNVHTLILEIAKRAITILLFLSSFLSQAQGNLWKAEPTGENPWNTETGFSNPKEEKSSISTKPRLLDSVHEVSAVKTHYIDTSLTRENDKAFVVNNSTETIRYFNFPDTIIRVNTTGNNHYKKLRNKGSNMHNANVALGMGIASASVINIFAFPINLVTSAIPTPLVTYKIEQFIADNPHATTKEINAVKMGISKKRFSNALLGVGIGCAVNLVAIIAISTI